MRNSVNYSFDLLINNPSETGIKEKCVWSDLDNFNLFDQVGVYWMHDILEGVAKYVMSAVIKNLTKDEKVFTLEMLNQRLEAFSYGPDNRNRPCAILIKHLNQGNIRLSSSEMLTLLRYFSILVGEFVPMENEYWKLYIKLRIIVEILSSTAIAKGTEELLQSNITEFNSLYLLLTNDTLKPKFHHLLHYHTALQKFGPLIFVWSMRFEAKHRISKIAARASFNRRNLTLSIAIKHQLKLNEMFLKGKLDDIINTGPETECNIFESQHITHTFNLPAVQKLTKTSWAKVSTTHYSRDTILVYSMSSEDDLVSFFKLTDIFVLDSIHDLLFKGILLETLNFDEHFNAFF